MAAPAHRRQPALHRARDDRARLGLRRGPIVTRADRVPGGYEISGQKAWISNAGLADQYVVFAKTDLSQRSRGVSAFLLPKDTPGMTFGEPMKKMGQRAIVCREIFFDKAFVPEENRLGDEGEGFTGLMKTFDVSRVVLAAAATGSARAAYEFALDYARSRTQFGKPIIEHQAVAFRLADMATRIESAWLMTLHAARQTDAGANVNGLAAMAALQASETAMFVTHAAVQTLGGWGYSREYPVEQWMRDVARGDRGGDLGHHAAGHLPQPLTTPTTRRRSPMIRTTFTEMFGVDHPLVCGGMTGLGTAGSSRRSPRRAPWAS